MAIVLLDLLTVHVCQLAACDLLGRKEGLQFISCSLQEVDVDSRVWCHCFESGSTDTSEAFYEEQEENGMVVLKGDYPSSIQRLLLKVVAINSKIVVAQV